MNETHESKVKLNQRLPRLSEQTTQNEKSPKVQTPRIRVTEVRSSDFRRNSRKNQLKD